MAAGETAGQAPKKVVSSTRKRAEETDVVEAAPLVHDADPELEKLLDEEEAIERSARQHHETPKFHGDGD
jgi:small subunit ribosomal protein S3